MHPRKWSRCELPPGSCALTSAFRVAADSWEAASGACCSEAETKDHEAAENPLLLVCCVVIPIPSRESVGDR